MHLLAVTARSTCLVLSLAGTTTAAGVHLVDSSGAGDFLDVQSAVDAAAEGDTILLRRPPEQAAFFDGFVVEGKSLSFLSVQAGGLRTGFVTIRDLDPGQVVVLSGLSVGWVYQPQHTLPAAGLTIEGCDGAVRVQGCELTGWHAPTGRTGRAACVVRASADVVLSGCRLSGGRGSERLGAGGPGLVADASTVVLHDCDVAGGIGGSEMAFFEDAFGGPGGSGAVVTGGSLYAAASSISGGAGGDAYYGDPSAGGNGGAGIRVGAAATAYAMETEIAGGPGGVGDTSIGAGGPAILGTVSFGPPDPARGFAAPDRSEESTEVPLTFAGAPGELVVLLQSSSAAARLLDPLTGYLHVGAPFQRLQVGRVPPSGELAFAYRAPEAPPGKGLELVLQAAFVAPGGAVRLSAPAHLYVLDAEAPPLCGRRYHVDAGAPAGGDGLTWATAFGDLNDALRLATDCPDHPTEVWVAEGTYRPAPPGGDRSLPFRLHAGTRLYGGFGGGETSLDQRDPLAHPVVLSGDLNADDAPGFGARDDNSFHVLRSGTHLLPEHDVYLDGLTVQGGEAAEHFHVQSGGGLLAYGEAALAGCTFLDSRANAGGGVAFHGDSITLVECRFFGNFAHGSGGGLYGSSDSGGRVSVANSVFAGNAVSFFGYGGAARVIFDCAFELSSSLVYANYAPFNTAGIVGPSSFETRVSNCVIWGNTISYGGAQEVQLDVQPGSLEYCCVQDLDGSLGGIGNLAVDPSFVDPLGSDGIAGTLDDDLRLGAGSPCVDAGRNADVLPDALDRDGDGDTGEPLPFDLDGNPRFVDDPQIADMGDGTAPIVDMGPYERRP